MHSFYFDEFDVHKNFLSFLQERKFEHNVIEGIIHFEALEAFESHLDQFCNTLFPDWQILSFPLTALHLYVGYMQKRGVPYYKAYFNNEIEIILPVGYRPLKWKLE